MVHVLSICMSSSCDWNTYYAKIGNGDLTWKIEEMPPRQTCGQYSQENGRFAFTTDEFYFLVADLSKTDWKAQFYFSLRHKVL